METLPIRTGIFGGSFNPIHIGHLALANYLCEYGELDEVWMVVSPQNPFKKDQQLLDDNLRLAMVKAAVADYPKLKACDVEFRLPRPSYMISTLRQLENDYPERRFSLVIGADNWLAFQHWKAADEIVRDFDIVIYPRPGYAVDAASLPASVRLVDTPLLEVSSTFIRRALQEGKDIRYFMHPASYRLLCAASSASLEPDGLSEDTPSTENGF